MKRFILIASACFCLSATPGDASSETYHLDWKAETPAEGGVKRSALLQFPEGSVTYQGTAPDATGNAVKDVLFGLDFWTPEHSDGSWDHWHFLRVWVKRGDGEAVEVTTTRLLEDVTVLETHPRRMSRFRWKLDEYDGSGILNVTLLQYPNQKGWLLLKVELEGEDSAYVERVTLSAYPGYSTGPKERERWMASGDLVRRLRKVVQPFDEKLSGIAFFNRLTHGDAGCLLVTEPSNATGLSLMGDYAVWGSWTYATGTRSAVFGLSGFISTDPEAVVRRFTMENAREMLQFLQQAIWHPQLDGEHYRDTLSATTLLLADVGEAVEKSQLDALVESYQSAQQAQRNEAAHEALVQMEALKARLLNRALDRWR